VARLVSPLYPYEGEATIAARIFGLDPGLGVLHADQNNRDSLAADLMEPIRPLVDRYLLELVASRTFAARDFYETRQGVCRIVAPLTHELAQTASGWGKLVGRVAEAVAGTLAAGSAARTDRLPTPLSGTNRSAGRDGLRRRPVRSKAPSRRLGVNRCRECGRELDAADRPYCDGCLPEARAAHLDGASAAKRSATYRRRRLQQLEWDRAHPGSADPAEFTENILPGLRGLTLTELQKATGLSKRYCSMIRRGLYVLHRRWWDVLQEMGAPWGCR
jgi:hypothetical protein